MRKVFFLTFPIFFLLIPIAFGQSVTTSKYETNDYSFESVDSCGLFDCCSYITLKAGTLKAPLTNNQKETFNSISIKDLFIKSGSIKFDSVDVVNATTIRICGTISQQTNSFGFDKSDLFFDPWWNSTFSYGMNITFTNNRAVAGSNIIYHYALNTAGLGVQSDCSDIRLINGSHDTELDFHIATCDDDAITYIDFLMPYCQASSDCDFAIYWENNSVVETASNSNFASGVTNLFSYYSFYDVTDNYLDDHQNTTNKLWQNTSYGTTGVFGFGRNITALQDHTYIIWSVNNTVLVNTEDVTLIYWLKAYDNSFRIVDATRKGAYWTALGYYDFISHASCGSGQLLAGANGDADFDWCLTSIPINDWFMYTRIMSNDATNTYEHAYKNTTFWGGKYIASKLINYTTFQFGLGRPDDNSSTAQDFRGEIDEMYIYYENFTATKVALVYDTYNQSLYSNGSIMTAPDETAPTYTTFNSTSQNVTLGNDVTFYSIWTDNVALDKNIFSWNGTYCNATFVNYTQNYLSGNWTNITMTINNTDCEEKYIGYLFYGNDTSGNWNTTTTQGIYITPIPTLPFSTNLTSVDKSLLSSFCLDNTTLKSNATFNNQTIEFTKICAWGCDNVTNTCAPNPFYLNLMLIGVFIGILIFGVWLFRGRL